MSFSNGDVSGATVLTASDHLTETQINELRQASYGANQFFNVASYGTALTGVPIQSAVDAATAAGGGIVFIPAGTYLIGTAIEVPTNTHLIGAGKDLTILRANADLVSIFYNNTDNLTNVRIGAMTVDGNGSDGSVNADWVISFSNESGTFSNHSNFTFEDLRVVNGNDIGLIIRGTLDDLWVKNCEFEDNRYKATASNKGFGIYMDYAITNFHIVNTNFKNNYTAGIILSHQAPDAGTADIPCRYGDITSCNFTGTAQATGIDCEDVTYTNVDYIGLNIVGCNFFDQTGAAYTNEGVGVNIQAGCAGVVVDGCYFKGNHIGMTIGREGDAPDNVVSNCTFYANNAHEGTAAFLWNQSGIFFSVATGLKVTGCSFTGHTKYAICCNSANGGHETTITGNRFENNDYGALLYAYGNGRNVISGNNFYNNARGKQSYNHGDIQLDSTGTADYQKRNTITGNLLYYDAGTVPEYGIYITSGTASNNNLIVANNITGCGTAILTSAGTAGDTIVHNIEG